MNVSPQSARESGVLPTSTGLVLVDANFTLLHADASAIRILTYPDHPRTSEGLQARLNALCNAGGTTQHFTSGTRTYTCRAIPLQSMQQPGDITALLFERVHRKEVDYLLAAGAMFNLSPRQRETVWGVMQGLTTKEIAAQMGVSPHTVKQFIRQSMEKLGVTTRSGIVGRIVSTDVNAGRDLTSPRPSGQHPSV